MRPMAQLAQDKDKLQRQDQQLSDYEAELSLLRRRCESLESDRDKGQERDRPSPRCPQTVARIVSFTI
jgi:chromosome segregation ATPase